MIRLLRRDGTISYGFHSPDGSWVEVPPPDGQPHSSGSPVPMPRPPIAQSSTPGDVRQFLREIGRRGGQARAARHSRAEIAEWGRVRHKPV